jgi:2-(1,2-epoxy-1,2-dihydrophenyl)acetyl-CoA isomerase
MPELLESIKDGIAILTINRPERRNAIDAMLCDALLARLQRLATDNAVAVIILTGTGTDAFCAGGDVKHMDGIAKKSFEERLANLQRWGGIALLLHTMPKITIAMVNGVAVGAGFAIAAACDFRTASATARFASAYAKIGRSGDFGGSATIIRLVGAARARELYLLGDVINAEVAKSYGLVNFVYAPNQLEAETLALAQRFAAGPRFALGLIKQNLVAAETKSLAEMIELEALHHAQTGDTTEHREAVAAFREKRKAVFRPSGQ